MPIVGFALMFLFLICSGNGYAEQAIQSDIPSEPDQPEPQLELFTGPKLIEPKQPSYPRKEQRQGKEGWVQLNFMVSPSGTPYEVVVVDSTGSEAFERSAIESVKSWVFKPALMDNAPIDAGANFKITFELSGPGSGAGQSFIRSIKQLYRAISDGDRERADEELTDLEVQNLYEDAYLNLAKYSYYRSWGTERQQLNALRRGIAHEDRAQYLPAKQFVTALQAKFRLEVQLQEFAQALKTWEKLETQKIDDNERASLQKIADEIGVLQVDDRSYTVTGRIGRSSSWWYSLLKKKFTIVVASGELAEIKLRCDKKYVFFRYKPEIQYRTSTQYGSCSIELVGNPGTTFSLTQF